MTIPTFPTLVGLEYPVKRSPMFSTDKQVAVSGKVTAQPLWTYPRYAIEISYSVLRSSVALAEWQTLQGFFNSVYGDALTFQFADPDDGSVTDQSFGTGDGLTTDFQLVRTLGGFVEPVFIPTGTTVVKVNGTPTLLFSNQPGGIIRFNSAPTLGQALTWTGTYNWLCRFQDGVLELSKFAYQFWEAKKVAFLTEKY